MHVYSLFFFFNDTATTEIYTLSLHDALPILGLTAIGGVASYLDTVLSARLSQAFLLSMRTSFFRHLQHLSLRSEEHTSELQSRQYLVCRLLLEKKKKLLTSMSSLSGSRILH